MKKLCSSLFSPPIDISDPRFIVLVAENRKTLYEIGYYCFLGFEGGSRYLYAVDSQSGKEAPMEYIENLFDLDPNTKKNVNMLYRIVKSTYTDSLADSIETITSSIQKVLKEISMDFEIPLTSDEIIKAEDIFKMANLRFSENEECFRDRLLKYILITQQLVLVFIIKSLFFLFVIFIKF